MSTSVVQAINLTSTAVEKIRALLREHNVTEGGLRIGVQGGGCSGLSYNMALDTEQRPGDKVFEQDGIKIFVDMKSLLYLNGTTLDWKDEGLMHRGFIFTNPSSSGTCGCGESFAV